MVTRMARGLCWGTLMAALGTLAGCPAQVDSLAGFGQSAQDSGERGANQTILHSLPADLAALLNASPIDPPTEGAAALASTSWSGTQDCVLTGDFNMLISGPGTDPLSDSISFDERGIPSEPSGFPWQFKRAQFTDDSFDLACTFEMSTQLSGSYSAASYVMTLTGQRSADGRTLTGTRRWGVLQAYDGPAADLAMTYVCKFSLSMDE